MGNRNNIERALLEQYILGLTTEEESKQVEVFLSQNPEVAKEIRESQQAIEQFAFEYAMEPPAKLRKNVLTAVKSTKVSHPNKGGFVIGLRWITGIAAALAFGFAIMTFLLYQEQSNLHNQIASLETKVNQLDQQKARLASQKTQLSQQFTVLKDINTHHVHIKGTQLSPKALFVVYWNEVDKEAYLNMIELPEVPTDKTLQLWADVDGKMVDMGVLKPNREELIKVPYIPNAESLNITLEPKGGSKRPTVSSLYANGRML